jgi:pimeloyl-ACP methyl ester carboxylesterase
MRALAHAVDRLRIRASRSRAPALGGARFVDTAAGAVRTLVRGEGPLTVFFGADPPLGLEHYLPLVDRVAARWRVVACELPGFGFSAPARGFDWSLESYAKTIGEVLGGTDTQRVILAPSCFTNLPALRFALDAGDRVSGFVAVQAPSWSDALGWMKVNDPIGLFNVPVAGQLLNWTFSGALESLWLDRAEPDAAQRSRFEAVRRARGRGCLYCLASGLQATRRPDPFAGARLEVPAALLWGRADRSHPRTPPTSFARYLVDAPLFEVAGAGHFPELSSPDTFTAALEAVAARASRPC